MMEITATWMAETQVVTSNQDGLAPEELKPSLTLALIVFL